MTDKPTTSPAPNPNHPKNIPANPNSIENGVEDPTPEAGKGGGWRAIVSWLKGWKS